MQNKHWGSKLDLQEKSLPVLKFEHIKERLVNSDTKVLEIGCGDGKFLNAIKEFNTTAKLYGCDIKPMSYKPDFDFKLIKENQPLPYKDKTFDVVIITDVLEHIEDYMFMINEVKRILKSVGWFVGFVPIEGQLFSAYTFYRMIFGKDLFKKTKDHVQKFKRKQLIDMFQSNFNGGEFHYSYHLLGQWMDATLFTLMQNKWIANKFWNENKYYNADSNKKSIFNRLLSFANMIAYYESKIRRNNKLFSAGLHFSVRNFEYYHDYDDFYYPFSSLYDDRWLNG